VTTSQSTTDEHLLQLLQICEDYFHSAGPSTHAQLDAILREHDITGGPGWLINMLGLTRLHLQHQHEATTGEPQD
jgi:hypothetical protein